MDAIIVSVIVGVAVFACFIAGFVAAECECPTDRPDGVS